MTGENQKRESRSDRKGCLHSVQRLHDTFAKQYKANPIILNAPAIAVLVLAFHIYLGLEFDLVTYVPI